MSGCRTGSSGRPARNLGCRRSPGRSLRPDGLLGQADPAAGIAAPVAFRQSVGAVAKAGLRPRRSPRRDPAAERLERRVEGMGGGHAAERPGLAGRPRAPAAEIAPRLRRDVAGGVVADMRRAGDLPQLVGRSGVARVRAMSVSVFTQSTGGPPGGVGLGTVEAVAGAPPSVAVESSQMR